MRPHQIAPMLAVALLAGACTPPPPAESAASAAPEAERNPFVYDGPKSPSGMFCRDLTPLQRAWLEPRWGCTEIFRPGD